MLRIITVALAGLLAGGAAWADAAAAYWRASEPSAAPEVVRDDARIAMARSRTTLATSQAIERRDVERVAAEARALLMQSPLEASAMYQLAMSSRLLGSRAFREQFRIAERISRRDVPTQSALLGLAVVDGDYAAVLDHLDKMVTVRPAASQMYLPLASSLADERLRRNLRAYAKRPWFVDFLESVGAKTTDPASLAALMLESRIDLGERRTAVLPPILRNLVEKNRYDLARALADRFVQVPGSAIEDFGMTAATTDAALVPLSWHLRSTELVRAALHRDGELAVEAEPARVSLAAERVTRLPAGTYEMRQELASGDSGAGIGTEWELYCTPIAAPQPTWRERISVAPGATRYRFLIRIPSTCPIQLWQLSVLVDDRQSAGGFMLRKLNLVRLVDSSSARPPSAGLSE